MISHRVLCRGCPRVVGPFLRRCPHLLLLVWIDRQARCKNYLEFFIYALCCALTALMYVSSFQRVFAVPGYRRLDFFIDNCFGFGFADMRVKAF